MFVGCWLIVLDFVLEYADGGDLLFLVMSGKLDSDLIGSICMQLAEALSFMAATNVIH